MNTEQIERIRIIHSILCLNAVRTNENPLQRATMLYDIANIKMGIRTSFQSIANYMGNVSSSALKRALRAGRELGRRGRPPFLESSELIDLESLITYKEDFNDPLTIGELPALAAEIRKHSRTTHEGLPIENPRLPVPSWATKFVHDHEPHSVVPQPLERGRADSCEVKTFYGNLSMQYQRHHYDQGLFFNMDESMVHEMPGGR